MILWKGEYDFKTPLTTLYVFESKNGWIIFLVRLHFLNIDIQQLQTIGIIPHVILLELLSHQKHHRSRFRNNSHLKCDFHRSIWNIHRCHSFACIL